MAYNFSWPIFKKQNKTKNKETSFLELGGEPTVYKLCFIGIHLLQGAA